jgi:predicted nucleic acid-binding protein
MLVNQSKVYWDSCAWIGFINSEVGKIHPLRAIWEDAQKGKHQLWVSAYAHLEVFKLSATSGDPLPPDLSDERVEEMFTQPFVMRVQLDSEIAKLARDFRRKFGDHGLTHRPDAIHLATAAYWNLDELHTWDRSHLLGLNGLVRRLDGELLTIRKPGQEVIGPLFAERDEKTKTDQEKLDAKKPSEEATGTPDR